MGAENIAGIFMVGIDILCTTVSTATKNILAQIGSVVGETPDADNVEWIQHVGFASRPSKPTAGKAAAQGYGVRQDSIDFILGSKDLRGLTIYGTLADGETCVYAGGDDGSGQARALFKKDGSVTLYTKSGNTDGGTGMMIQLDAAGGGIRLVDSFGNALISSADGWQMTAKGSALTLKQSGDFSLVGKGQTQVDGSSICLGSIAVPGINSVCTGVTGIAAKASLKVVCE